MDASFRKTELYSRQSRGLPGVRYGYFVVSSPDFEMMNPTFREAGDGYVCVGMKRPKKEVGSTKCVASFSFCSPYDLFCKRDSLFLTNQRLLASEAGRDTKTVITFDVPVGTRNEEAMQLAFDTVLKSCRVKWLKEVVASGRYSVKLGLSNKDQDDKARLDGQAHFREERVIHSAEGLHFS